MTPAELRDLLHTEGIQLTLTMGYSFSQGMLSSVAIRLPNKGPKTKPAATLVGEKGQGVRVGWAATLRMFADIIDGTIATADDEVLP